MASDAIAPGRRALTLTSGGRPLSDPVWVYRRVAQGDPAVGAFIAAARRAAAGRSRMRDPFRAVNTGG